jgi:hypothetical protein
MPTMARTMTPNGMFSQTQLIIDTSIGPAGFFRPAVTDRVARQVLPAVGGTSAAAMNMAVPGPEPLRDRRRYTALDHASDLAGARRGDLPAAEEQP